jgi:hypothetical protein
MPSEGSVFDGFTSIIAQDADTHPSYLPEYFVSESVNRTFRGGVNRTRPSIRNISIVAGEGEDPTIVDDIQNGNFQGAYAYRKTKYEANDGIALSVSGTIYFLKIINNVAYAYKLIEGNDPDLMHTWFVQAEDRLYIQNGYQNAITWGGVTSPISANGIVIGNSYKITSTGNTDFISIGSPSNAVGTVFTATGVGTGTGQVIEQARRLNPFKKKMPIGTIMEYAFGRVFVSDRFNLIYASDIIYGNGFNDTLNTENFTEIGYWQGGGAFSTPAMMGNITGMKVMPDLGDNLRGQGALVILCAGGAFSMDVSLPRAEWTNSNIQRVSLLGRGCTSPYLTTVNSELWFRSHDGWAFYSNSQTEFYRYFSMRKLSRDVNKWVSRDTSWLKQFASTMFINNYLINTVAPQTKSTQAENGVTGLHRYHRGMVVLDLDQGSSPSPDAQLTFRWNGLWTGIRPSQLLTALINGEQRGFAFSFDKDDKNRLYEVTGNRGADYGPNGTQQIESFFVTGRYDFSRTGATNKFLRKRITGGEMWLSEIPGEVTSRVEYRSDSNPCWSELKTDTTFGCPPCAPIVNDKCYPRRGGNLYKRYKFNTPDPDECNALADIPSIEGSEFQIKVNLAGNATVDRVRVMANLKNNEDSPIGDCPSDEEGSECPLFLCCQERYWDYSIA